jgi:predicted amidohydrolase YtcJ
MRRARRHGRAVAVHCVSRAGLAVALAAWEVVGVEPGDRLEHGALVPLDVAADLAGRGITVVTQPSFVRQRGDQYLADVEARDQPDLWRCATLLEAGLPVAGSSDAPYGSVDPWAAMATAVDRRTASGALLGPGERITPCRALELYLGPLDDPGGRPRRVQVGAPADLCLLDLPLVAALEDLSASLVRATVHGDAPVYERS